MFLRLCLCGTSVTPPSIAHHSLEVPYCPSFLSQRQKTLSFSSQQPCSAGLCQNSLTSLSLPLSHVTYIHTHSFPISYLICPRSPGYFMNTHTDTHISTLTVQVPGHWTGITNSVTHSHFCTSTRNHCRMPIYVKLLSNTKHARLLGSMLVSCFPKSQTRIHTSTQLPLTLAVSAPIPLLAVS